MAVGVPFKLKTSDSDFQDFSSTEENYLAFEIGRQYAIYDSSKGGSLGFIGSGGRAVGTLTNTTYDSSEGSHVNITLTTTSTNIFQNLSTADSVGASLHRIPVYQNDSDGQFVIREFNDSDRNTLVDRLNSRIFTSDYPGSYKLASDAPSADYAVALSNVMTDTRSDSNGGASPTIQYNIYQRKTMTSPTQTLPFAVKRADGDSGTYQGLQLMTDSQIGHTLAEIGRNRITGGDSNEDYQVGSYLIRSSAQGAPTAPGTWVAKGTATDTRLNETETNFTRIATQNFIGAFTGNFENTFTDNFTDVFTGNVETEFTSNFTTNRASNFQRTSTRISTQDFTSNFTRISTQNFTQNFQRTSTRTSTRNRTASYIGTQNFFSGYQYSRTAPEYYVLTAGGPVQYYWNGVNISGSSYFGGDPYDNTAVDGYFYETGALQETVYNPGSPPFVPPFTEFYYEIRRYDQADVNYTGDFIGNFAGNFVGDFVGNFTGNFLGNFVGDFTGNFLGNFTGDFIDTYTGDFVGNFAGGVPTDFTGDFIGDFTGEFTSERASTFVGDFIGDYIGTLLGGTSTNIETFTLYVRTA